MIVLLLYCTADKRTHMICSRVSSYKYLNYPSITSFPCLSATKGDDYLRFVSISIPVSYSYTNILEKKYWSNRNCTIKKANEMKFYFGVCVLYVTIAFNLFFCLVLIFILSMVQIKECVIVVHVFQGCLN